MGFLSNLIRRWVGTKAPAPQRALPGPVPDRELDSGRGHDSLPPPVVTAGLPWLAPVAAEPEPPPAPVAPIEPPVALAVVTESVLPPGAAIPRPLGLPGDLYSPLLGVRGLATARPTPREQLADLRADAAALPESPEAASRREWTDQALVTGGYLTAEQLAAARREATAEVDPQSPLDPTALAEQRAARRAASARRRQERAEQLAERRATDIRYLGRGVSEALNDRQGDRGKLEQAGLPLLNSPAELAERLRISVPRLRWLAFHAEVATRVHYVGFEVAKKGGGTRRLSAPHRSMALAQRWVLEEIVARLPTEPPAHGFVPGRSIVTNARGHAGRAVVVNLDLAAFFPSIGFRRVRAVFERAGYSPAIASILGLICTEAPRRTVTFEGETLHIATGPRGLPQGACTSPGLANQVARRLDRRLGGLAGKLGATYTRYADDLTFSGGPDLDPRVGSLMAQVRRIASSEGFTVNEGKTRVLRPNTAQVVTGLVVNDRPGVPRAEVRRLRAILHRARVEGLDAQNREARPDFRAYLLGKIAFVGMARPDVGARLLAAYRAVESA